MVPADRPGGRSLHSGTGVVLSKTYEEPVRKVAQLRAGRDRGRSSPRQAPTSLQGVPIVARHHADHPPALTAPAPFSSLPGATLSFSAQRKGERGANVPPRPSRAGPCTTPKQRRTAQEVGPYIQGRTRSHRGKSFQPNQTKTSPAQRAGETPQTNKVPIPPPVGRGDGDLQDSSAYFAGRTMTWPW